jgi:hypothetical protein
MKTLDRDRTFRCSFCTSELGLDRLIAGPGVYICAACVELCHDILRDRGPELAEWKPPWDAMSDDEILGALPGVAASAARVDDHLAEWVQQLRSRNVSWARIGAALGMTRQSAWERFSGED